MKPSDCVYLSLACLLGLFLSSAAQDGNITTTSSTPSSNNTTNSTHSLPLPTETMDLLCQENCTGDDCHFKQSASERTDFSFLPDSEFFSKQCNSDPRKMDVAFPPTKESGSQRNASIHCLTYMNSKNTSIKVLELVLNKPKDVNGTTITCKVGNDPCTIANVTESEIHFVYGLPESCEVWVPTTSAPTTTTVAPSTTSATNTATSNYNSTSTPGSTTPGTTAAPGTKGDATAAPQTDGGKKDPDNSSPDLSARLEWTAFAAMAVVFLLR